LSSLAVITPHEKVSLSTWLRRWNTTRRLPES